MQQTLEQRSIGKRVRFGFLAWVLAAFAGAVLVACGSSDEPSSGGSTATSESSSGTAVSAAGEGGTTTGEGSGGTLRIGMTASNVPIPNTPADNGGEGRRFVGLQVYDALVRENTEQADPPTLQPALAESWSVAEDEVTWTFNLRQGVAFHDGSPWNADAAIFQMDRVSNESFEYFDPQLKTTNSTYFAGIESYSKVDDYTIQIVTKQPYAFLLYDLVSLLFASPAAVMEFGNADYVNHASGTGPFMIDRYVDGEVMELVANPNYWRGAPKLERLVLLPMPEPATRLAALQSGDIDWAEAPPPDGIEQLRAGGFQIILGPYPHTNTYFLNQLREPLNDPLVRQALSYAVDRDGTMALINGVGAPANQFIAPGHPWFDPSNEGYTYDPEKAKALLAEAGYPDGISLRMIYPTSGSGNMFPGPMNEKLQADFAAAGIELELVPTEWLNIQSGRRAGFAAPEWADYDILHNSWSFSTPTMSLAVFLSYNTPPNGCCNTGGFTNPEYDRLWEEASRTFDTEQQNALLREAITVLNQDAGALFTLHDLNLRVFSPNVKNFVQPYSWTVDLLNVYVE